MRACIETLSALLALCEGNPLVTGGFLQKGPVMHKVLHFFIVSMNKLLNKQLSWWWFETPTYHINQTDWLHSPMDCTCKYSPTIAYILLRLRYLLKETDSKRLIFHCIWTLSMAYMSSFISLPVGLLAYYSGKSSPLVATLTPLYPWRSCLTCCGRVTVWTGRRTALWRCTASCWSAGIRTQDNDRPSRTLYRTSIESWPCLHQRWGRVQIIVVRSSSEARLLKL